MAVRIVLDGPGGGGGRKAARGVAVLLGVPLIVAGVIGLCGLVLLGLWLVYLRVDDAAIPPSDETEREALVIGAVCAGATLVGMPLGVRLLRGKRRLVLFLRKFGFADATKSVSYAAVNALGRSWRLVTFDDERVQAVGGSSVRRRFTALVALLTVAGVGYLVWWLSTHSFDDVVKSTHGTASNPYLAQIGAAFFAAIFVLIVIFLATVTGVTALMVTMTYGFARRIENAKTDRIRDQHDVRGRLAAITSQSGRIFAPRLVVVKVADPVWQHAAYAFAHSAGAVIIDVSMPGESLRWEITTLVPAFGHRCVFVGSFDRIVGRGHDGRPVFVSPFARDLDGREVLAYRTDRAGMKRFSRALHATIEARIPR